MRRRSGSAAVALALLALACVDLDIAPLLTQTPPGQHPIANPSFAGDLQPILTQSCATSSACHLGPSSQLGLDLSAGQSRGNLVGVAAVLSPTVLRVNPTKPDSSFFIWMMESDASKRGGGARMPLGSAPLAPEVIQSFKNWIANGAPDN